MAGIGFALRRDLRKDTYSEVLKAYVVAGIIGSGPWIISIGSMLFIGLYTEAVRGPTGVVTQFLATVTHLMAVSLIASGLIQLLFVRFIADRLFEKNEAAVAPNVLGVLVVATLAGGIIATVEAVALFEGNYAFRVFFVGTFVALCNVWVLSALLSGLKAYRRVLATFAVGYAVSLSAALAFARFGLVGYLAGFFLGHALMLFGMLALVLLEYRSDRFLAFEFLQRGKVFLELAWTGALFNLAVWADKFVFWVNPETSVQLIGPIRYSVVYDVPIFVAYLSVIPGMAVFLVRIETDFAEAYERYYTAVREGDTLAELRRMRNGLVSAARAGLYDIIRIQGMTVAILIVVGDRLLNVFRIPPFYGYLFKIDVVGVGFQTFLLGIITILFYLDYRRLVLSLCALFAGMNLTLSIASQHLGPRFYGFGFTLAAALTSLLSLNALSSKLDRLEYETFMR
jgi:polysaccharide biosynthesis protein PelG